jgi:hypothetical protein
MSKLQKVISGGQTGVDQAALRAAMQLDFKIGGWCPPGRVSRTGIIPEEYSLTETAYERSTLAPDIPRSLRTEYNIRDSDATLVLRPHDTGKDPGTMWTIKCARLYNKPCYIIDPCAPGAEIQICSWLKKTPVKILNIAGPAEETSPGINQQAYQLLVRIFKNIKSGNLCNGSSIKVRSNMKKEP